MFRIIGDVLEIFPSSSEHILVLDFFGDELESLFWKEALTNERIESVTTATIFPAKHFVTSPHVIEEALPLIRAELEERIAFFTSQGKLLEAERIKMKTEYDMEMLQEVGYVNGVENYSMYLSGRKPGMTPSTLLNFFPKDYLTFIDESHISIPQIGGMYAGDRARKENLVAYGFRLPSALENRPLKFDEFENMMNQVVFVSATP
jgi:excinuclease ABC subunit B